MEGLTEIKKELEEKNININIARTSVTGYGEDLIKAAFNMDEGIVETMAHYRGAKEVGVKALISVNKGLVTQASAAIPIVPLYMSVLYKVMKENNVHEGCIEQIERLLKEKRLLADTITDEHGWVRMDDLELRDELDKTDETAYNAK